VELVSEHVGVAILPQLTTPGFHADGVVVKPLADTSLCFKTCVILRADNSSWLIEEYVRMFLRRYSSQRLPRKQVKLSPFAQVLSWKTPIPPSRTLMSISLLVRSSQPYSKAVAAGKFDLLARCTFRPNRLRRDASLSELVRWTNQAALRSRMNQARGHDGRSIWSAGDGLGPNEGLKVGLPSVARNAESLLKLLAVVGIREEKPCSFGTLLL
jgi:hypothetical protein